MECPPNSTPWRQNCNAKPFLKGANTNTSVKYGLHLKLTGYFNTFITLELSSICVETRLKQGAHTLHQPRGVASTVRVRTAISRGQVSGNHEQCFCLIWPHYHAITD